MLQLRAFFVFLFFGFHIITFAQQQKIETFGYQFEAPKSWEVDWVRPEWCYVEEKPANSSDAATFLVYRFDSTKVNFQDENSLKKRVMQTMRESIGDSYLYSNSVLWKRTTIKDVTNNGITFREFVITSPPDEEGDATWVCVWATFHAPSQKTILFLGGTFKEPKKPEIDKQTLLETIFRTIKISEKAKENKKEIAKNKEKEEKKIVKEEKAIAIREPKKEEKKVEPAPEPVKVVKFEEKELKQGESIDFTLLFLPDEAKMEKEAKKELKRIIDFLKANPNIEVSIVGYASKIQEDNRLNLAQARAEKVLEELRQANIASARMNAKGSKELGIDKRVKVVIDKIN